MKKFLTVLLALSVVFTYTVGSAFALPSDTGSEAGLAAAKAEAVKELKLIRLCPTMMQLVRQKLRQLLLNTLTKSMVQKSWKCR